MNPQTLMSEAELACLTMPNNAEIFDDIINTKFTLKNTKQFYDKYVSRGFTLSMGEFSSDPYEFAEEIENLDRLLNTADIHIPVTQNDHRNVRILSYMLNANNLHYEIFKEILYNVENIPDNDKYIQEFIDLVEDEKHIVVTARQVKTSIAAYLFRRYKESGLLNMDCASIYEGDFSTISDSSPRDGIYVDIIGKL